MANKTRPFENNLFKLDTGELSPCKIKVFNELNAPPQSASTGETSPEWQRRFRRYSCENRPTACLTFWNYVRVQNEQKPLARLVGSIRKLDDLLIAAAVKASTPHLDTQAAVTAKNFFLYKIIRPKIERGSRIIQQLDDPKVSDETKLELYGELIQLKKDIVKNFREAGVNVENFESFQQVIITQVLQQEFRINLSINSPAMLWMFFSSLEILFISGRASPLAKAVIQRVDNEATLDAYNIYLREYLRELIRAEVLPGPQFRKYTDNQLDNYVMVLGTLANTRMKQCEAER